MSLVSRAFPLLENAASPAALALLCGLLLHPPLTLAEDESADGNKSAGASAYHLQLKRQATDRGTDGESTKTTLRWEAFPSGSFSRFRVDLQFPDEKTGVSGSPFNPRMGDIKLRADLAPINWQQLPWTFYAELTLPTADPENLGSGKYQLAPAVRSAIKDGANQYSGLVQQVVSFAGDAARKDINYTKLEAAINHGFDSGWFAKFTLKPAFDWQQDGASGAVGELEGGRPLSPGWEAALMAGARLWGGNNVPSTYGSRLELKLSYHY